MHKAGDDIFNNSKGSLFLKVSQRICHLQGWEKKKKNKIDWTKNFVDDLFVEKLFYFCAYLLNIL